MARLTHINGSVVSVSDDKVDRLVRSGFAPSDGQAAAAEGYDAMTVDQLKDEIRNRNETRDDETRLALTGTKAELIAALEADD